MNEKELLKIISDEKKKILQDIERIDKIFKQNDRNYDYNMNPLNLLFFKKKKQNLTDTIFKILQHQRSWSNAQLELINKIEMEIKNDNN